MSTASRSIHRLKPLETGGTDARHGFAVQDHVAASHCLDMLEDATLSQVWCESQDDVTLIWIGSGTEEVEFVQVKSNELDQLWSIAKLVTGEKGNDGKQKKSILEKSLQFDQCNEPVRFRIVTCRPVKNELKLLTLALDSPDRSKTTDDYVTLLAEVTKKLGHIKSANGNGCEFWLDRTFWLCIHSLDSIRANNLLRLAKLVENQGQYLPIDHVAELYQRLLTKVYDGGLAKWDVGEAKKKLLRNDLLAWFAQAVNHAVHPGQVTAGQTLEGKLTDAGIAPDQFEAIAEMRMQYRLDGLTPKYAEPLKRRTIEGEISARLHTLRSELDGGLLENDGVLFHAKCLGVVNDVFNSLPDDDRPPIQNLYGFMYNLADRCTHRFVRARP